MLKAVLKFPGAKWSIARWITSFFPGHEHYIEPYCGSAAVFFSKQPSKHEVLNDLNGSLVNLFEVMRTRGEELAEAIMLSPWSEAEYNAIEGHVDETDGDALEHARRFLVRSWQAHGGTIAQVSGWKHNGLRGSVYPTQLWKKLPARLMAAAERLQDAEIRCRPALEVIDYYNAPNCLHYVDPPYMFETRARKYYKHEMTTDDHEDLLTHLVAHKGMIILSGYATSLYDEALAGWMRTELRATTEHGNTRTEVLWINPRAVSAQQLSFEWEA